MDIFTEARQATAITSRSHHDVGADTRADTGRLLLGESAGGDPECCPLWLVITKLPSWNTHAGRPRLGDD